MNEVSATKVNNHGLAAGADASGADAPGVAPPPKRALSGEALEFAPGLLAIQENPPGRLPRVVLYSVVILFGVLLTWSIVGKLDIVASAEGHLVPESYVKIVQPADGGVVQEILVHEGEHVSAGQVLMRMDARDAHADEQSLQTQLALRSLQMRRADAELNDLPLEKQADDPEDLYRQVDAQFRARRLQYQDELGEAQQTQNKLRSDYAAGQQVLAKLQEVTPLLKQQADAYTDMGKQGYVPQVQVGEKQRDYLEKSRDLKAQASTVASLAAAMAGSGKQVQAVTAKYHSDLRNERLEAEGQFRKLQQDWVKQTHKSGLLELKAPQAGIAKDLATHTVGSVVAPGTVLLSLVPDNEALIAEVMVKNDDIGFLYPKQKVKLKLAAYPFQQYGMLDGEILTIGADASDNQAAPANGRNFAARDAQSHEQVYKVLVALADQQLVAQNQHFKLLPGMQVTAEVNEGQRTVMEYLLSPLQKTVTESGHER